MTGFWIQMGQFPEVVSAPFDLERHKGSTLMIPTATMQQYTSPHWDKSAVCWPIAALIGCEVRFPSWLIHISADSVCCSQQQLAPSKQTELHLATAVCLFPLPSVRISASALHWAKLKSLLLTRCQFPPYFSSRFFSALAFVLSRCRLDCYSLASMFISFSSNFTMKQTQTREIRPIVKKKRRNLPLLLSASLAHVKQSL